MHASNSVNTIFRCMSCSFGARDQNTYAEHIKHCSNESTSETLHVASDVEEVQNDSSETVKSRQTSHVCTECHLSTNCSRELLLHLRDVHDKDLKIFVCKFCSSYASKHAATVYVHARRKHPERALKGTRFYNVLQKESVLKKSSANIEDKADADCVSTTQTAPCEQNETSISDTVISGRSLGLQFLGRQLRDIGRDEFVCLLCSFSHIISHIIVKHIWKAHMDKLSEVTAEASTTEEAGMTNVLYKCDHCSYSTRDKFSFYSHCSHHQFKGPSKCPHCSFCALTDGAISLHVHKYHTSRHLNLSADRPKSIHTKISVPCKVTKRSVNSPCKKLYAQQQKKKKWFECPCCPFKSQCRSSYYHHKARAHPELRKRCRTMSKAKNTSPGHELKKTDAGNTLDMNSSGGHKTEQRKPPSDHLLPDATSTPLKQNAYNCDLCSAKFKTAKTLYNHKQLHLDLRRYQCPLCGKRTNYLSNAQSHIYNVHKNKSAKPIRLSSENAKQTIEAYKKQFFGHNSKQRGADTAMEMNSNSSKETKQRNVSNDHLLSHAKSAPLKQSVYKCDICSAKFQSLLCWKAHKDNVHCSFARYQCPLCGFRSNYVQNTNKHISTVHGDKSAKTVKLSLEDAKQTFEAYRMQQQKLDHPGFGPGFRRYQCPICGVRTNYAGNMQKHILKVHSDKEAKAIKLPLEYAKQTMEACENQPVKLSHSRRKRLHCTPSAIRGKGRALQYSMSTPNNDTLANSAKDDLMQIADKQPRLDNAYTSHSYLNTSMPKLKKCYACSLCKRQSCYMSSIHRHVRNVHRGRKARVIVVEGKMSLHKSKVARHDLRRKISTNQKQKAETSDYSCTPYEHHSWRKRQQSVDKTERNDSSGAEFGMQNTVKIATGHFLCDYCPYMSVRKHSLLYHKQLHRPRSSALIKCEHCDFWVTEPHHLYKHKVVHTVMYMQKRMQHITLPHMSASLESDDIETASERHKAHLSESVSANDLDVHNVATSDKGTCKIDETSENMPVNDDNESTSNTETAAAVTKGNSDISTHCPSSTVNRLPSWCCERCPYSSNRLACFKRHVWLHGKQYLYKCHYCDYSVQSYWQLVSHVLWHFAPNKHLVYAQPVSNLDSFPSQLPNRDSIPDSVASVDRFIPSFENSDVFLLSDAADFQCPHCPFVAEQRSEIFSHMMCHCMRSAAYSCPFCNFCTDLQERHSAHVFLHFNLPGCRHSSLPPNVCHSDDWKQLDAAIEALVEKHVQCTQSHCVQTHECSNRGYGLVESAASLNVDSLMTENKAARPADCEDNLSEKKPLNLLSTDHKEDGSTHTLSSVPQAAGSDMEIDECDKQHANVTHSTVLADGSAVEESSLADSVSSATANKTRFCHYCDRVIDDPAALAQHEARHLVGYHSQHFSSLGKLLLCSEIY